MIEDIYSYRDFDFATEAERQLADLGRAGKRTMFIRGDVIPADAHSPRPTLKFHEAVGDEKVKKKQLPANWGVVHAELNERIKMYGKSATLGPFFHFTETTFRRYPFVFFTDIPSFTDGLGAANKPLMQLYSLVHETGHTLIDYNFTGNSSVLFKECAADAYAAIRFLQRFGGDAREFLSQVSALRASGGIGTDKYSDTNHLTTVLLDKIIADSAQQDNFANLSHTEAVMLAAKYARAFTPAAGVTLSFSNTLKETGKKIPALMEYMQSTTLSSPADHFSFYVFAKHALATAKEPQLASHIQSQVEKKLSGKHLRDIFGYEALNVQPPYPHADISLADTLKTTTPRRQKAALPAHP